MSLAALARQIIQELEEGEPLAAAPVVAAREVTGAVLVASRFGEVWLVLEPGALAELQAEELSRDDPRPIVTSTELGTLRGLSDDAIRALLEVRRAFPGAQIQ